MRTTIDPPRPHRSPALETLEIFEARIRAQHQAETEGPRHIGEALDEALARIARRRARWLKSGGAG